MLDYDSYKKIIEYLEKNELEKLRKYVEEENNKSYIKNARKYLTDFLNISSTSFYAYADKQVDGSIIVSNYTSVYHLKTDEILTRYRIEHINNYESLAQLCLERAKEALSICTSRDTVPVDFATLPNENREIELYNQANDITHRFDERVYNFSKYFLGEDAEYNLIKDMPGCIVQSDKGKGLILGKQLKKYRG